MFINYNKSTLGNENYTKTTVQCYVPIAWITDFPLSLKCRKSTVLPDSKTEINYIEFCLY